jgi:exodeoxyribonuclease VII large subunit
MIRAFIHKACQDESRHIVYRSSYSVGEITQIIKGDLEADPRLGDVWVEGEISNWTRSRAGHCYLTLKDSEATIRAVLWRSVFGRLDFSPRDGQAVRAHGRVSVYEPQGQYQFYVDDLQTVGQGDLYLQLEALKARLADEGLFDSERKRPLEPFPACVGVVTSPTGAALRDILNVLSRRWPLARVLVSPTLVQGERAPAQIAAALGALYARTDVDVILLARGGGSIEDLWAFNDERVARAIAASPVPVVCGVGHEIDWTISDFVADRRAPTPSAAAEVAVPEATEVAAQVAALKVALREVTIGRLRELSVAMRAHDVALRRLSPRVRIDRGRQAVDGLGRRAERAWEHRCAMQQERMTGLVRRLESLNPYAILDRGYAVVRDKNGRVIRKVAQAVEDEWIDIRVSDGRFPARVGERQERTAV